MSYQLARQLPPFSPPLPLLPPSFLSTYSNLDTTSRGVSLEHPLPLTSLTNQVEKCKACRVKKILLAPPKFCTKPLYKHLETFSVFMALVPRQFCEQGVPLKSPPLNFSKCQIVKIWQSPEWPPLNFSMCQIVENMTESQSGPPFFLSITF